MEEDKKKNMFLLVILVVIILVLILVSIMSPKDEEQESVHVTNKINMVTDNSRFFTVSGCVSKYVTYLSSSDISNLLLLLDDNYKTKNNISDTNIFSYVKHIEDSEFTATRMYEEKVNDNVMKYYVAGYLKPIMFFENVEESNQVNSEPFYVIVNLDLKQNVFSITPYDGTIFLKGGAS